MDSILPLFYTGSNPSFPESKKPISATKNGQHFVFLHNLAWIFCTAINKKQKHTQHFFCYTPSIAGFATVSAPSPRPSRLDGIWGHIAEVEDRLASFTSRDVRTQNQDWIWPTNVHSICVTVRLPSPPPLPGRIFRHCGGMWGDRDGLVTQCPRGALRDTVPGPNPRKT